MDINLLENSDKDIFMEILKQIDYNSIIKIFNLSKKCNQKCKNEMYKKIIFYKKYENQPRYEQNDENEYINKLTDEMFVLAYSKYDTKIKNMHINKLTFLKNNNKKLVS